MKSIRERIQEYIDALDPAGLGVAPERLTYTLTMEQLVGLVSMAPRSTEENEMSEASVREFVLTATATEITNRIEQQAKELAEAQARVAVLEDAAKDAPAILKHMIRTSEKACPPMHYLLTHDGLYGFHMANLLVRNDGKEYNMEADWADNCGRLVKRLTEALAATDTAAIVQKWREKHYEECAVICRSQFVEVKASNFSHADRFNDGCFGCAKAIRAAAKAK